MTVVYLDICISFIYIIHDVSQLSYENNYRDTQRIHYKNTVRSCSDHEEAINHD